MKTIAVIPSRNEAATVGNVVQEAKRHVSTVLVVNDHSSDNTGASARKGGAIVLDLASPSGYSAALLAGSRYALENGYATIVMLDADGAHDPADIPAMLDEHRRCSADLTIGERFHPRSLDDIPSAKRWANHFATVFTNLILGTATRDMACGFRVLSPMYTSALLEFGPMAGFSLAYYCVSVAKQNSFRITQAPVAVRYNANELACTSQSELLDLIVAGSGDIAGRGSLAVISKLERLVRQMRPLSVLIGEVTLFLHPVENSAYVFQRQPDYFIDESEESLLNIDSVFEQDRRNTAE